MLRLWIAVAILAFMLACGGVLSLREALVPETAALRTFEAVTGSSLDGVQDADFLEVLKFLQREVASFKFAIVMAGFFVLFGGFLKAQKWAYYAFTFVGAEVFLDVGILRLIRDFTGRNVSLVTIGVAMLIAGLLIPMNIFLPGEAKEVEEEQ